MLAKQFRCSTRAVSTMPNSSLFFLLLLLLTSASSTQEVTRKKRALVFPKGTNFVMTFTLIKAMQSKLAPNWNLDLEFDMTWPMPPGLDGWKAKLPTPKTTALKRRHRRELYANFELALDSQGLPGKLCVLRSLCEAKLILNPPGISLIEDVLRVVLSYPYSSKDAYDAYDHAFTSKDDCDNIFPCPFSILDLILNYDEYLEQSENEIDDYGDYQ